MTVDEQYALIAQLGVMEGIKAGAFPAGASDESKAAIQALVGVTSPAATDLPTTLTLVNEIRLKLNAVITALKIA